MSSIYLKWSRLFSSVIFLAAGICLMIREAIYEYCSRKSSSGFWFFGNHRDGECTFGGVWRALPAKHHQI